MELHEVYTKVVSCLGHDCHPNWIVSLDSDKERIVIQRFESVTTDTTDHEAGNGLLGSLGDIDDKDLLDNKSHDLYLCGWTSGAENVDENETEKEPNDTDKVKEIDLEREIAETGEKVKNCKQKSKIKDCEIFLNDIFEQIETAPRKTKNCDINANRSKLLRQYDDLFGGIGKKKEKVKKTALSETSRIYVLDNQVFLKPLPDSDREAELLGKRLTNPFGYICVRCKKKVQKESCPNLPLRY